jgi:hypothetical protein
VEDHLSGFSPPMSTSNAGDVVVYSTILGIQWAKQSARTYTSIPSYTAASFYGQYYRPDSLSDATPTESHVKSLMIAVDDQEGLLPYC